MADQLKEIGRSLLEDILNTIHSKIYLWSRTCSKKCILAMINFQFTRLLKPSYKEIVLRFIVEECGEVLGVEGHNNTFGDSKNH